MPINDIIPVKTEYRGVRYEVTFYNSWGIKIHWDGVEQNNWEWVLDTKYYGTASQIKEYIERRIDRHLNEKAALEEKEEKHQQQVEDFRRLVEGRGLI